MGRCTLVNKVTNYSHRVKYYETDKMARVHHGAMVLWFETARTEFIREHSNYSYNELEKMSIWLPVSNINIDYHEAISYDEEIKVVVKISKISRIKIIFDYEVYNSGGKLACSGKTTNVFSDDRGNLKRVAKDIYEKLWRS